MAYDPEARIKYMIEQHAKYKEEEKKREEEEKKQYYTSLGQAPPKERSWQEKMYVDADNPSTMDNGTATLWYIIIMVVGAIFNDRLLIWIIATIIWWCHINRKARRQKEWDKMQEEKKNGGQK